MAILVTGAAGFIGFHLTERLLARGETVIGLDNLNDYYEVALKEARLARLQAQAGFAFHRLDLADRAGMERLFGDESIDRVVHLAAQAGVRYSLTHPHAYAESNLTGFLHVLEGCRSRSVAHLVYASSSSVYGGNTAMPFRAEASADHPLALYGATKKANEAMAHAYSHLYGIPTTGLRFFTVYGPWGRPDMALFRGHRARARPSGRARSHIRSGPARSFGQQRAVSALQHRQRPAGGSHHLHPHPGGRAGAGRAPRPAADATRRCARHLGRLHALAMRHRLQAVHAGERGHRPLRRVVPGLLSGLNEGMRPAAAAPVNRRQ
jgi:nucleoside-diphosphate-sugar epimerase